MTFESEGLLIVAIYIWLPPASYVVFSDNSGFLYCYERAFMSNLQKSKRFDLIDKFNDTSRYLDDIFTIDNPEFAEHIPDIYPRELQLNKANTSDKETSFLDLNIKVVGGNIHTSVYDKRDYFLFLM